VNTCELCHEHPATVVSAHIVGKKKNILHLCSFCASKQHGVETKGPKVEIVVKKGTAKLLAEDKVPSSARCPECGMLYEKFKEVGRFSCHACYDAFEPQLERLLKRIHGAVQHCGKGRIQPRVLPVAAAELKILRDELEVAVAEEAFERAADLRDRIFRLEQESSGDAPE
jgi:protein arginine kinase activator